MEFSLKMFLISHFDFFPVLCPTKTLHCLPDAALVSPADVSLPSGVQLFCITSPALPWHREEVKKLAAFLSHNLVTATIATCRSQATLHTNDCERGVSACVSIHGGCVPPGGDTDLVVCRCVCVFSPAHMGSNSERKNN